MDWPRLPKDIKHEIIDKLNRVSDIKTLINLEHALNNCYPEFKFIIKQQDRIIKCILDRCPYTEHQPFHYVSPYTYIPSGAIAYDDNDFYNQLNFVPDNVQPYAQPYVIPFRNIKIDLKLRDFDDVMADAYQESSHSGLLTYNLEGAFQFSEYIIKTDNIIDDDKNINIATINILKELAQLRKQILHNYTEKGKDITKIDFYIKY